MPKEVKQWITVKGNRVPIFEGESKADAIKRMVNRQKKSDKAVKKEEIIDKIAKQQHVSKKTAEEIYKQYSSKQRKEFESTKDNAKKLMNKKRYEEKDEVRYEPEDFEDDDREEMIEEALKANKLPRSVREDIEKNGTKKEKALLNRYSKKNQQSKDEDTKAKQIARNKKEADERNNESSNIVNGKNLISNSTWKPGYYKDDGGDMYEISYEKRGNKIYQLSNGKGFDGSYIEIKSGKYDAYNSDGDFVLSTTSAAKATKAAWKTPKSEKSRLATKSEVAKERKEEKEASKYWENKHKEDKARYRSELGSTIKNANAKLQNMSIGQLRKLAKRLEPNVEMYTRYNESKNSKKTLIEYIMKDYKFYYK